MNRAQGAINDAPTAACLPGLIAGERQDVLGKARQ